MGGSRPSSTASPSTTGANRIGLFGYYECIPDPEAGRLLLETARDWLQSRDCTKMRGPWSFVSQEWGAVVEGFAPSPVIMGPYNPPYYIDDYTAFGLRKAQDMLCWSMDAAEGYEIPERIMRLTDAVASTLQGADAPHGHEATTTRGPAFIRLSNDSIIDNWGYSPVTEAEAQAMADDLKLVVQSRGVIFAEDEHGEVIGFRHRPAGHQHPAQGLERAAVPDRGLPLLLRAAPSEPVPMFGLGVIPEYQGKAVDSLLYRALYESLYSTETWVEINYVLEDNWPMVNAIKKLNATPLRRYRVFEMEI